MQKTITVRGLVIGAGMPKIIAPLVGGDRDALLAEARALSGQPVDMAEWRADCFGSISDPAAAAHMLTELRAVLGDLPLLFTIRTKGEGGKLDIPPEQYGSLNEMAAKSGQADLVDVELFFRPDSTGEWINRIHEAGALVVGSHHNFHHTPPESGLVEILDKMAETGADLLKLAVMPHTPADVLALLSATNQFREIARRPLVTMSMGSLGAVSRVAGEVFGSAMTFGSVGNSSAPGQFPVYQLFTALKALHWEIPDNLDR